MGRPCQSAGLVDPLEQRVSVIPIDVIPGNIRVYVLAEQVSVVGRELVAADVLEPVFAGWGQIREAGDRVVVRKGKTGDPLGFHKCSQLLYGHGAVRLHGMIMQFDPLPHGRVLL